MAMPYVPDVKAASWHSPYQFSGRLPFKAVALMVGFGVPAALIAGGVGYFGGAVTRWIVIQATHVSAGVATFLSGPSCGLIGNGVAFGALIFPALMVGVVYPTLIGSVAGGAVRFGARVGKCRKLWVPGLLGLLAGGLAYMAFVATAVLMKAPLHESSRILEVAPPPLSYGLMVIDGLLVLYAARMAARSTAHDTPFCELCETWYGTPKRTTITIKGATPLVEALAGGSVLPLQAVPVGVTDPARIQLDLSRCECGRSDYNLVATVHWDEHAKGKTSTESKTEIWFSTTLPASLGAEIERWSMPTQLPAISGPPAPSFAAGATPSPPGAPPAGQALGMTETARVRRLDVQGVPQPDPLHKLRRGARRAALMLALVIVAAGAVLLLPAMGLKLPSFPPTRVLVTVTTSEAVSRQATATPATDGTRAATELSLATDRVTPTPGSSVTRAATGTASLPHAVVTTDALNVRTGPGTNYPKTGLLRKGDQVVVTGRTESGDWLAVTLADGKKGWVAASLVKLDVPVSGITVAQNIPKPSTPAATSKPAVPKATLTIDEQIAAVAKGAHGALPQPGDMGGVSAGGEAEVTIVNDTPHVLTVLVGSPNSTSITVEACSSCKHYSLVGPTSCQEQGRAKRSIRLKPGSSQVVARADDRSVTPFLGTWELKPDTAYSNCFFIVVR
ncbi:MAG: SH3 domain-containing protein [Candidatus Nanopelagicales bacterium]